MANVSLETNLSSPSKRKAEHQDVVNLFRFVFDNGIEIVSTVL